MRFSLTPYGSLALAILCEVGGTTCLKLSEQFTKAWATAGMLLLYVASFYLLSIALTEIPLGVAYAIWSSVGIVLTAIIGAAVFKQSLDALALVGIALIIAGVVVVNAFSRFETH